MTDELPERPDADDCTHCDAENSLSCRLEAGLRQSGGRRVPVLKHVTNCEECGARRTVTVDMDELRRESDAVTGGMWSGFPNQGTLTDC